MADGVGRIRPLAVTADAELADSLARIAAAAGVSLQITADLHVFRREVSRGRPGDRR